MVFLFDYFLFSAYDIIYHISSSDSPQIGNVAIKIPRKFFDFLTIYSSRGYSMSKRLSGYQGLIKNIGNILARGRQRAYVAVDNVLVETYWHVGREIVEYEQQGNERAEYGSELLRALSRDLKIQHGKGFSISNVYAMRQFYLKYQKFQTVSGKLTWSHYVVLLGVSDDLARGFYAKQCVNEAWSSVIWNDR